MKVYESGIQLDNDTLLLHETIFHNANGYIGVRSCFEEGYAPGVVSVRGSYINGFYDFAPMSQAEKLYGLTEEKQTMLNVADTQGIGLYVCGERFDLFTGEILSGSRTLDMRAGITSRTVVWRSPQGREVEIHIQRMTSFTRLPLFTIEYTVKPLNFSGEVQFLSTHRGDVTNFSDPDDPRVAGESFAYLKPVSARLTDGGSVLVTDTVRSGLRVCTAVANRFSKPGTVTNRLDGHGAETTLTMTVAENEPVTLTKACVFCDSRRYRDCEAAAEDELRAALSTPLATLYAEQAAYLRHTQDALTIDGDDELCLAVHFNLYQLTQSVSKDPYGNIAAKGLSGEGYEGHFFWDTEMYIQPFFVLTNPELAKNLLAYRYATLPQARANAAILGHTKGALYPWRTIMGSECSGHYPSGTAQYHINGDIAYAVTAYYLATKDMEFVQWAAEIVYETARLWLDTGHFYKGQFHIHHVTGPDEYTCLVNNNYYTNICARHNLRWAAKFARMPEGEAAAQRIGLTADEVEAFERAADVMVLPYDDELRINPQDDAFLSRRPWNAREDKHPLLLHYHPLHLYRHQVCKQADTVLAHFLFEDEPLRVIHNSFAYYENITTHDSSLSTCIFSIVASRLGLAEKAYAYFADSAKMDLFNTHHNTKDGIHTANMGGVYMTIVYGFGGLRLTETGLSFAPSLPEKWTGYRFNIQYEGSRIEVSVRRDAIEFILLAGAPKTIRVYGKDYLLADRVVARKKYKAIIFDLDGVICHTDKYHYLAWKAVADRLGIDFNETKNNRLRGVSRAKSFAIILEGYRGELSAEEHAAYLTQKNELYREFLSQMTPSDLDADVDDTLLQLRALGLRLAIGSSSKNAGFILQKLGLDDFFDAVSDGNNITRSKPDPEVFLAACGMLGLNPADCLVVEDAKAGVEAALAAGMDCAAMGDAAGCGLATYDLRSFSELVAIAVG